ncbi:MAG: DUF4153 domain-containing protein [Lachnospiraceae bacterium]|nr:DUF4153 domain-containing protein [Lachnospiraceae bacterium]
MKYLKDKLALFFNIIKQSCYNYRVAVASVVAATVFETICCILNAMTPYGESSVRSFLRYESDVLRFLILFILAVMFTESILSYEKKERRIKIIRILCFVFAAVISAVFVAVQEATGSVSNIISAWAVRYYIICILLLVLGIIYFSHKKSGIGFIEYMMHVAVNFCVTTAIYIILCIGVSLILLILDLLFFDGFSLMLQCCYILLTGLYYVPGCIAALSNMDSNIDDEITRVLTTKVLTSMTVCAMGIVYAYLLKILVTWQMPSNEIFGIVSGLFCIGMFIWVIDYYYRDDTKYALFLQRLPYGMIPMIPVQAYSMCVRIYNYGMTTGRYMGMLLVVFEIFMLLICRFRRDKIENVILVLCICVVVAGCVPGVNMFSVSNRWQRSMLVSVYDKIASGQEITQNEYDRMEGAYKYLRWKPEMKDIVEKYDIYAEDFVQMLSISDLDTTNLTSLNSHYIHCCQLVGELDVDDYSRFDMINQDPLYEDSHYKTEAGESAVDFSAFRFYRRSDAEEKIFEVDISDFADKCFTYKEEHPDAAQEEVSDAMRPYQQIVIDDETVLYLNHFEVGYDDGVKDGEEYFKWTTVNISGMLLSR